MWPSKLGVPDKVTIYILHSNSFSTRTTCTQLIFLPEFETDPSAQGTPLQADAPAMQSETNVMWIAAWAPVEFPALLSCSSSSNNWSARVQLVWIWQRNPFWYKSSYKYKYCFIIQIGNKCFGNTN